MNLFFNDTSKTIQPSTFGDSGPGGVSITYHYKVKPQPKHDLRDSRTSWHLSLKAAVCLSVRPESHLLSSFSGLTLVSMIHLISALHQCPVSCRTIGQFAPHGSLIRLTCTINPRCETVHGFDLAEPKKALANKAANVVGQVNTLSNQWFNRRSPILMCDWVTAAHHLIIESTSSHYTAFLFHSTLIRNFKMRFLIMKNVLIMTSHI